AMLVPRSYVEAVQRAGGIVLAVAPDAQLAERPQQLLSLIDGLMLVGGVDVDPSTYGAAPHPRLEAIVPERDRFELALLAAALERDRPVLGICRGMQMLNIVRGGTLDQHLPERHGHEGHRPALGQLDERAAHTVRLQPGSLAARAAGEATHSGRSHHH